MADSKPNGAVLETTLNKKGHETATTTFASPGSADEMYIKPNQAIPVILVPGIMGSPLIASNDTRGMWSGQGKWAWFPDDGGWVAGGYGFLSTDQRRRLLDPSTTKAVATPEEADDVVLAKFQKGRFMPMEEARRRGWGSVMINSYGEILNFLETQLQFIFYRGHTYPGIDVTRPSDVSRWGEVKGYQRLSDDELRKAAAWCFPVYAVGYNWVDTNANAAAFLKRRIDDIRKDCRERLKLKCDKVILVTHSMGGLVARQCAKTNEDDILGVVHGVQPATGAGTAYARVRGGWEANPTFLHPLDSIVDIITAWAMGERPQDVMAVFSNGPGPLELLPNQLYGSNWLNVEYAKGSTKQTVFSLPKSNPYKEIYSVANKWWQLVHPWVIVRDEDQSNQAAINATWDDYIQKLAKAERFHTNLGGYYHPNTFAFCGVDSGKKGWHRITWTMEPLMDVSTTIWADQPSEEVARDKTVLKREWFRGTQGSCILHVPSTAGPVAYRNRRTGENVIGGHYSGAEYRATLSAQDDPGDQTVPGHSGLAPRNSATFFATMQGFAHQPAYDDSSVKAVSLYSIIRLASQAKPLA